MDLQRIDAATQEALARAKTTTLRLQALTFAHSSFTGDMHYVNHPEAITVNAQLYDPLGFTLAEVALGGEPGQSYQLRIDGIDENLQFWFAQALHGLETIQVTATPFVFDSGTKSVISTYSSVALEVNNVQHDLDGTLMIDLGFLSASNKNFPSVFYNPEDYPDMYR